MKNLDNIEELFRENLGGFEADPGAGVWESISQNLPAPNTAATGSAAAGKAGLFKLVAAVAVISSGIGITAGYFYSEKKHSNHTKKTNQVISGEKEILEENTVTEDVALTKNTTEINTPITEELHSDKIIIRDEKKQKNIIVSVKESNNYNSNKSISDKWITKSNHSYIPSNNSTNSDTKETTGSGNPTSENSVVEVKETDINKPVAVIMQSAPGGPAPVTITFSSSEKNHSYEWIFSDADEVATSQSVSHTFETPGEHKVILVVKDRKGNIAKDEKVINVTEIVKEVKPVSKLITRDVNVITPNNDGFNDFLVFETENIISFTFIVVDMEGTVFYETNDPNFKWYGTKSNGDNLEDGVYFYQYKATGTDGMKYEHFNPITIRR